MIALLVIVAVVALGLLLVLESVTPQGGLVSFDVPPPIPYTPRPGETDPDDYDG